MPTNEPEIWALAEEKGAAFAALSDQVWETPELNYAEFQSAAAHAEMLQREGFRVHDGAWPACRRR